ncbi:MAG: hypothetical protein AB1714_27505, partial [Acidobacteriota bacterium]
MNHDCKRGTARAIIMLVFGSLLLAPPACKEQHRNEAQSAEVRTPPPSSEAAVPPAAAMPVGDLEEPAAEAEPLSPLPEELQAKIFLPWSGDLDGMVKRRVIRALVVYNKTTYFLDKATPHGIAYDAMKQFEAILNRKLSLGKLGVHVVFLPVSRDQLLQSLAEGKGDVALG